MASGQRIMISYQWDSQKDVIRIKKALEGLGYKTLMDLDDMRGNTDQKMVEGVEGASLIIMCMSAKYETSVYCNKESQYAQAGGKIILPVVVEKGYRPSGALGLIIAGSKYVDFSDPSQFDNKMGELKDEITSLLGGSASKSNAAPIVEKLEKLEIQPKSSQDHYMSVGFVETRSNEWNGAVDNIIAEIRSKGVERGQLLCIDAHNNGKDGYPIVSAFFDWNTRSSGHLNVAYELQNANYSWATLYEIASNQAAGIQSDDVISMTGCCNSGGNSVFCVFSEVPSLVSKESIKFVESRSESWNGAADKIIGDLVARGVKKGQLLSIDGHSNGAGEDPTFSAFWNPSLPVKGPLSVGYKFFNADYGWPQFYERIATEANKLKRNDFISITGSVNTTKSSVMYLFYYQ